MTAWMEPFAFWLADVYLAATILLLATAAIFALVRQPSLRMAVAWGMVPGLLLAACLCLSASRPHVRLWPAPPVKTNSAAQNSETSRRLYAGGLQAAPDARIKTAGVKSAARRSDSTQRSVTDDDVSPNSSAPIVAEWGPPNVGDPDRLRFERFEAAPVADIASGPPAWASRLVAGLVWAFLAGSLFVASWLALGVWRASRLVRESEPAPPACLDELHALVAAPRRPPRLGVNRRLLTPVATGAVRPAILLPEESSRGGEPHALRAVLAHEWTHIKNGDLWLLALDRIVLCLLWAHPLYWWTRRRFRADQEFLADAAAAAQIGAADYAALLVHWARKVTEQRSLTASTAVGIWERPAGLTERVATLLADSNREILRISGRTRVGVAAALALLSLAAATISLRPPQTALAQAELARAEDKSDARSGSTVAPPAPATPIAQSPPVNESPRSEPAPNKTDSNDVRGICRDKQGKPLSGVQIFLYAIQKATGREQLLQQGTTDADGHFRFRDCIGKNVAQLSWQLIDEDGAIFEVVARRAGLGTVAKSIQERGQQLGFTLTKAASLTGTVRDPRGQRLAGAIIHDMYFPLRKTGWLSAKSDANGNFTIADLSEYHYAGPKGSGPPIGLLSVEHPEYGMAQVSYKQVPGRLDDVVLDKAAAIVGTVVYGETGKPAAGVYVFANWIDQPIPAVAVDLPHVQTDKNGRYRLRPLPEGLFNLDVSVEPINGIMSFEKRQTKFVAAPIEQIRTKEGQTAGAPPIRLVKGGVVKGRLYQYRPDVNGVHDPVKLKEGEKLEIIVFYGPSLPGPGVVGDMTFVRPDGTFELRLPPGMHYLELPNSQKPDGRYRLPYADMGEPCTEEDAAPPQLNNLHRIKIREGQTTEIELSVFRPRPTQKTVDEKKTENAKPASPHLAAANALKEPKIVDYHVGKDEIGGMCLGRGEPRLSRVEVSLYIESLLRRGARQHDLLGRTVTNEQGQFLFEHVRHLGSGEARSSDRYVIVARRKGLATEVSALDHAHDWVDLKMANAVVVRGTVKDEQGKPVVGALVRCNGNAWRSLPDEVHSARTDALGQFQIDDVATVWGCVIEHPDYPAKVLYDEGTFLPPEGSRFSTDVLKLPLNVTLVKGSVVEGQVIDSVTGRPGVGVTVTMQAMQNQKPYIGHRSFFAQDPCLFSAETQTDSNGHYRFTRLPAGRFAVYLTSDVPARASIALRSLDVPAATGVHAPDIRLVKGGIVHGRLIDNQSGQPARLGENEKVTITVDGPARPRQNEIQTYLQPQSFPVANDGTFQLRLPPGKNLVRVSGRPYFAEQPADRNAIKGIREIEIKEGQEATLEFRVVRVLPMKRQSAGVTSNASSAADADGAKPEWFHVRGADLGGIWSDAEGHGIAGAKVTLISTDADGSKRNVLKATTTNSWGQFLFVCAPCLAGPNQHYELVLSRDNEPPDVRKMVQPGEWLELRTPQIEFRESRQVPMKPAPEKPIKNSPAPASGAVTRPAPIMVAEAPGVSPKIVDDHLEKDAVGGLCLSEDQARLAGVEVLLCIDDFGRRADNSGSKLVEKTTTNEEGQFVFRHVPPVDPHEGYYLVVARGHGCITMMGTCHHRHAWLVLGMGTARPFKGTVKDQQGKPVAGALIRCNLIAFRDLPGIEPARTNARGEFEVDNVGGGNGRCVIEHPDYARRALDHLSFDEVAEVKLSRGGVVEGQVVDTVTGKPAGNLSVHIQPINPVRGQWKFNHNDDLFFWVSTKTDSQGRYRIGSVPTGEFIVFVSSVPGRASVAPDPLPVSAGQVVQPQPIRLVKGGLVKGRLIDDETGEPAVVGADELVTIGAHGPSRPRSGAAIEVFDVKTDGTFEMRLPPGRNSVSVAGGPFLVRKPGDPSANQDIRQIDVKEGTETTIEFRVIRQVPMKAPEVATKKPPAATSGAVARPAPVMVAEAPSVSPKIVDDHLEKDAVGGLCLGRDEVRIAGVEVALYIVGRRDGSHELVGRTITNDEGQFVFRQVPNLKAGDVPYLAGEESYLFVARKKGLATSEGILQQRHDWVDLLMGPGVSMNGVVPDEQGKPIPGALVSGGSYWHYGVPDEAPSVRTDERGEFQIDDLPQFGACSVSHPDYVSAGFGQAKKNPVVATLRKGSVVEGQVIDGDTGQPVADALVSMETLGHFAGGFAPWGRRAGRGGIAVTTDRNGRYKFRPVGPGTFNLSFRGGLGGVASAAIDALKVGRQQTVEVPPIRLAKGATVTVRLVFNDRSQDISMGPEETVVIGIRSGEASARADAKPRLETLHMRHDGTIGVWLPAGKHALSLNGGPFFALGDVQQGVGHDLRQVDIKGGEEASVIFRVVRITPSRSRMSSRVQRGAF